jgi:hypothetical protein
MHLKLGYNLVFIITLEIWSYVTICYWKYLLFILFCTRKKLYKNINKISINMQANDITWMIVILQKIRKKNQWIWSYYDRETLELRRKNDGETSWARATWSRWSNSANQVPSRGRSSTNLYMKQTTILITNTVVDLTWSTQASPRKLD